MKPSYRWAAAAAALIMLIVIVDRAEDWVTHIEYPLNIWRMDLDDLLANLGLFLGGVAALITVFRKADRAQKKADQVSERINGGMAELAKEHVAIATAEATEASHFIDLLGRVTTIEKQRDDCHDQLEVMRTELGRVQAWVVTRLDKSGNGRTEER